MNILQRLISLVIAQKAPQRKQASSPYVFNQMSIPPRRAGQAWLQIYGESPWLHVGAKRIAQSIAGGKMRLYTSKRKTDNEITDHPALDLLRKKANEAMSGIQLIKISAIHKKIIGEFFWIRDDNALGRPAALWPIPPHWVYQRPYQGWPFFKVQIPGGSGYAIPKEYILWERDPDP